MKPRELNDYIIYDDKEYKIKIYEENSEIPDTVSFDSAKIVTYCPYCDEKYELQYSGYFPNQIEYKCNECESIVSILKINTASNTRPTFSMIEDALQEQMEERESYAIGYNYATKKSEKKSHSMLKNIKMLKIYMTILFLFLLVLGFPIFLLFLYSIILLKIKLTILTIIFSVIIYYTSHYISNYIENKYMIKDSKLEPHDIKLEWLSKGIRHNMSSQEYDPLNTSEIEASNRVDNKKKKKKNPTENTIYD